MLKFEPFSMSALKKAIPYVKKNPSRCSDLSAGDLYLRHGNADIRCCDRNDTFADRRSGRSRGCGKTAPGCGDFLSDRLKSPPFLSIIKNQQINTDRDLRRRDFKKPEMQNGWDH